MAKVNVSLPDELLDQVDSLARELRQSRSGLVQEATAAYVSRLREQQARERRQREIESAMSRARTIADQTPRGTDTTELIRSDRDSGHDRGGAHE